MPLDPSIPLQAGVGVTPPANPLALMGQYQGLQQQKNALAVFAAQQAQGQAAQASIDPATGQQNQQKFGTLLAANPTAAYGAQQALAASQQQSAAQSQLQQQQRTAEAQKTAGLLTLPDSALAGGQPVFDQLKSDLASGAINQQTYNTYTSNLPPPGAPASAFRQALTSHLVGTLGGQEAISNVFPSTGTVDSGPVVQPVTIGGRLMPNAGVITPVGGAIAKGLAPGEATTPISIDNPDGTKSTYFRGQLMPNGTFPLGTGRLPPALRNPNAPPAVASPVAGGPMPAPVGMSAPPGVVAGADAAATASRGAFAQIADQGQRAQSQLGVLGDMLADTKQFTTGPGASAYKALGQVLTIAPRVASAFGITTDKVASAESFDKLAAQIADAQGAGSDARLAVNQHANPGSNLSPAGVDLVIRQLQGNSDYQAARAKLAASYSNQNDRPGFEAKIGAALDPRVFQYNRMTPEQKVTFYNSLADKPSFKRAYGQAQQLGALGAGNGN